jgi:hypothetical protein
VNNSRLERQFEAECTCTANVIRSELRDEQERLKRTLRPLGGFVVQKDSPFDGILSWLGRRSGGNVIDQGIIGAGPGGNPRNAFDFDNLSSYYDHCHDPDQWLSIDFKQMQVYLTDYSVQANPRDGECLPKSWVLEGSNDSVTWFTLDTKTNREALRNTARALTFTVSNPRMCRQVRYRKTCGMHDRCLFFYLTAIEFFGSVSGL